MDQQEISQSIKHMETDFQEYLIKLKALQEEQNVIISQFIKQLEERRMAEIRNKM